MAGPDLGRQVPTATSTTPAAQPAAPTAPAKAKGLALHIGINWLDPAHYGGWDGYLPNCHADAEALRALATAQGFRSSMLLSDFATREGVIQGIRSAARALKAGDTFLLTYAGHGGTVPDEAGYDDEEDGIDETWCLYDGQILDDELHELWAEFAEGVRILVLSDSCHSGTITKDPDAPDDAVPTGRFMPPDEAVRTFTNNTPFYVAIQQALPEKPSPLRATVRLLSGCQDDQISNEHPDIRHGRFTATLLYVWNNGGFDGDYAALHKAIIAKMPEKQQPNHYVIGPDDPAFAAEKPFSI